MSQIYKSLIPHIKKFAVYLGLNPEVASKNWPIRGTYRIAPASEPAPTFTHNFPLKQDFVKDLGYETKEERLGLEAMEMVVQYAHTDARRDVRNLWNVYRLRPSQNLTVHSLNPPFQQNQFIQVSEKLEATL